MVRLKVRTLVHRSHHHLPLGMVQRTSSKASWLEPGRVGQGLRHLRKSSKASQACRDTCRRKVHRVSANHLAHRIIRSLTVSRNLRI